VRGQSTKALAAAINRAVAEGHRDQAQQALEELLAGPYIELEVLRETAAELAERDLYEPAHVVPGTNGLSKSKIVQAWKYLFAFYHTPTVRSMIMTLA